MESKLVPQNLKYRISLSVGIWNKFKLGHMRELARSFSFFHEREWILFFRIEKNGMKTETFETGNEILWIEMFNENVLRVYDFLFLPNDLTKKVLHFY